MKKWLLGLGAFFFTTNFFAQNLVEITQNSVIDVKQSSLASMDVNGDGKLDLYISGVDSNGDVVHAFYLNNGYGTFIEDNSYITDVVALSGGSAAVLNDLLLISGKDANDQGVVKLYRFNGTTYVETTNVFQGITTGKAAFIDYDGDGSIDIFIGGENGNTAISSFYKNDGSDVFTAVPFATVAPMKKGDFVFGQFSNSGNQTDLFYTGINTTTNDTLSYIYTYNAGNYELVSDTLVGYVNARVMTHNFSSATYKDVIVSGIEKTTLMQYVNAFIFNANGYVQQAIVSQNYTGGDIAIADFDMDSNDDVIATGKRDIDQTIKSQLLLATPSGSTLGSFFTNDATTSLEGLFDGRILAFDFENDGDVDLIITGENADGESDTRLYRNINVCNATTGIDVVEACEEFVWINGQTYMASNNTATFTLPYANVWGCDSIVTLNLAIKAKSHIQDDRGTICDSLTWINGQNITQTTSGLEYIAGTNVAGCDSIITLNVVIKHSTFVDYNITECNQYQWVDGNGQTYTHSQNNVLYYIGPNSQGCDSLARLNLVINTPIVRVDNVTACMEYTWIDGNTYTNNNSTATYHVGTASNGCDSIAKLNLVISNILLGHDYVETCQPYTWIDGHTYYDSTTTVTHTIPSMNGCDSIVTLHLTFNHIDTDLIIVNGVPHVVPMDDATYQWMNCETNQLIAGATDTIFEPHSKGKYACIVTYKQCSDTSSCYNYGYTSVNDLDDLGPFISVYPNPSEGEVTVQVADVFDWVEVGVYDVAGQQIRAEEKMSATSKEIALHHLPKGVYLVKINTNLGTTQERIVVR